MTYKKLNSIYWLNKEIEDLEIRIREIEETLGVSSSKLSGMPKSNSNKRPTEDISLMLIKLKNKLTKNKTKLVSDKIEIENYISRIDDIELRLIVRMRNIDFMSWQEIGKKLNMDRTTASRRYHKLVDKLK